ncbi:MULTISPECIES: flagellar hook-basal body complex protein [Carnobacterium]|uniref:Flagellar basal-body rod protein FlgG n=1 Tax=Carnobacterium alterfunditum TaxID=28230 RepID=A0A1N6I3M1_9LACT|nr:MULTISPECIES: flagellar hook-basal body complex protein [Carnobacterium]MBT2731881.1 flagellar hook-basal body complex protein [Carnobacterium sp. ISL-102]SIO26626.1 flagellar basal-body rod protein FlgG [Carnobacterium alterfunditum]
MIRSLTTLNNSFNILQKKQENISANVANINTAGYKSQEIIQSTRASEVMSNHLDGPLLNRQQDIGGFTFGNQIDEIVQNFSQGGLKATTSTTDVAIQGDGFFTVQAPNGETSYTRNGNFNVNDTGELVTQEGYRVMGVSADGQSAPIQVNGADFAIDNRGNIAGTGNRLMITEFEDTASLTRAGDTLYTGQGGTTAQVGGTVVQQSYLETSNVETVDEITNLMQVSRAFEANQKALSAADETLRKAVNEVGKV